MDQPGKQWLGRDTPRKDGEVLKQVRQGGVTMEKENTERLWVSTFSDIFTVEEVLQKGLEGSRLKGTEGKCEPYPTEERGPRDSDWRIVKGMNTESKEQKCPFF